MQKIILKTGIFIILAMLVMPIVPVFAEEIPDYAVLAPLPGVGDSGGGTTTLQKYIPAIFKLAIGLSVVAAVLLIVIGGIQYITTDAIQGKSQGKERIKNAIIGLVFIIAAWLILATINPNLLTLNLDISSAPTSAPPGGILGSGGATLAEGEANIRNILNKNGIDINADPCVGNQTKGCTNLDGLPVYALQGIFSLKESCTGADPQCAITITGGTEGGHLSHGVGKGQVDMRLSPSLDAYIKDNAKSEKTITIGNDTYPLYVVEVDGKDTNFILEGDHWHVP